MSAVTVKKAKSESPYREYIERIRAFIEIEYDMSVIFERNGETALFHDRRGIVPGDFIVINNRVKLQKQLYMLLHEVGHVMLRESEAQHARRFPSAVLNGRRPSRAHKIDTLREEVLAWEKGLELATDFQIPVDDKVWHSMVTCALYKYLEWSKRA
jgi:hypothetical protein